MHSLKAVISCKSGGRTDIQRSRQRTMALRITEDIISPSAGFGLRRFRVHALFSVTLKVHIPKQYILSYLGPKVPKHILIPWF